MATTYSLLNALTALDSLRRERLDRLVCIPAPAAGTPLVWCHQHPAVGAAPFGGEITDAVPLADQVAALTETGLWGAVALADPDGEGAREVRLWAGKGERAAWDKRVTLSLRSARAGEVLAAGGDVKLATWRRQIAMDRLEGAVWDIADEAPAEGGGVLSRSDLVTLSQTARATVYKLIGSRPEQHTPSPHLSTSTAIIPAPEHAPTAERLSAVEQAPTALVEPMRPPTPAVPTGCRRRRRPLPPGELVMLHGRALDKTVATPAQVTASRKAKTARDTFNAKAGKRFSGIAAAVDGEHVYLPGGQVLPWTGSHLGDLADLVATHRLGWGGGEQLPAIGEVWLYPEAFERLGLPEEVDLSAAEAHQGKERSQAERDAFAPLEHFPAVTGARAAGWDLERVHYRMRLTSDSNRAGAVIVVAPWMPRLEEIPLLMDDFRLGDFEGADGDPDEIVIDLADPEILVRRLQDWVEWVRVPFQLTPAVTGMALLDHTRPPRRSVLEDPETRGAISSPRRDEIPDQPPFKAGRTPQIPTLETNFSWWRRWDSLTAAERTQTYVHAYDHRSHVLNPWLRLELGIEGLEYRSGVDAAWPGDEAPGYYLVDEWDWPDWTMPDPGTASQGWAHGTVDDIVNHTRRRWVTGHTLKQLDKLLPDFTRSLTVHESYRWAVTGPYLAPAGELLREARNHAPTHVATTAKATYAGIYGKLRTYTPGKAHLHRPDWYDMIAGAARTALVAALVDARTRTGATPLVVDRDTILYLSNDPDPRAAWPGNPAKLDNSQGGWRPIASARLDQWGPTALADHKSAWDYRTHIAAMSAPGQA